jgi:hypothetical protein
MRGEGETGSRPAALHSIVVILIEELLPSSKARSLKYEPAF